MDLIYKQLIDINLYIKEHNITLSTYQLNEGVTYYDMRSFLTILRKASGDDSLKKMLKELIKTIAKLEIKNIPVPTIQKLKSVSPQIFPETK
jgi:hypothetical protein